MKHRPVVSVDAFQSVPERVTEIQQSARAGRFFFVFGNDVGFNAAGRENRAAAGFVMRIENAQAVFFQRAPEIRVGDQAVLDDFGVSRAQFAFGQSA